MTWSTLGAGHTNTDVFNFGWVEFSFFQSGLVEVGGDLRVCIRANYLEQGLQQFVDRGVL
jgi:hypothetical protein